MRVGRTLGGIALILLAVLGIVAGAVAMAGGTYLQRRDALVDGRAPGTLRFSTEAGTRYTVALSARPGGVFELLGRTERRRRFRVRDGEAAQARCTIAQQGGPGRRAPEPVRLRGDRQTVSEVVGTSYASVGRFTATGGRAAMTCRFDPPRDLLGTVTETPLMIHETGAPLRTLAWTLLLGGVLFVGLGVLQILRGTVWRDGLPRRS